MMMRWQASTKHTNTHSNNTGTHTHTHTNTHRAVRAAAARIANRSSLLDEGVMTRGEMEEEVAVKCLLVF